jgi:carbon monoxide dehydrogenase subunit G
MSPSAFPGFLIARFLLFAAALATAPVALAQTVTAHREGEAVLVEAFDDIDATPQQAWEVLTDYEGLSRFIPDMTESRVIMRNGNSVLVDQKGSASLFLLRRPVQVRLEIVESPCEWVTSRAVGGSFKEMDGRYDLRPQGGTLRFTYHGRIVPDFWVPDFMEAAAVRRAVSRQFGAMVNEIRRRVAADRP